MYPSFSVTTKKSHECTAGVCLLLPSWLYDYPVPRRLCGRRAGLMSILPAVMLLMQTITCCVTFSGPVGVSG
jgi:hypothetical protein